MFARLGTCKCLPAEVGQTNSAPKTQTTDAIRSTMLPANATAQGRCSFEPTLARPEGPDLLAIASRTRRGGRLELSRPQVLLEFFGQCRPYRC
jgi:hypothetical protein